MLAAVALLATVLLLPAAGLTELLLLPLLTPAASLRLPALPAVPALLGLLALLSRLLPELLAPSTALFLPVS